MDPGGFKHEVQIFSLVMRRCWMESGGDIVNDQEIVVELVDVTKVYPLGKTEVHAVRGVSFTI